MAGSFPYTEAQRRQAVAWAIAVTANTPLAPPRYERYLLEQYQLGLLSLEEMLHLLESSIYQIVYRSQAVHPLATDALHELLAQAQQHNAHHQITGLLLYSEGRFVQVLEGPHEAVRALYARIQADTRHWQVVTVGEGPEPVRRFAEWTMGFGQVALPEVASVLAAGPYDPPIPDVNEHHIQALFRAFGLGSE